MRVRRMVAVGLTGLILTCAGRVLAQQKRTLTPADYGQWEQLAATTLSQDGKWISYGIIRVDASYELRYRDLTGNSTKADIGKDPTTAVPYANSHAFSADSRWMAYVIGSAEADRDKAIKAGKPLQNKLGLVDLMSMKVVTLENISSFSFSEAGSYLTMRGYPIKGRESKGADLIVRDLTTGLDTNFGNIAAYSWQHKGTLLAMVVDAESKSGNGVQLFDPAKSTLRTLDSASSTYTALTWRKDSSDLAVLKVKKDDSREDETHIVLAWSNLASGKPTKHEFDPTRDKSFAKEMRIVDFASLQWAEDGKMVFFGLKEWDKKPEKSKTPNKVETSKKTDDEPAGVEVWHARDNNIMPQQKLTGSQEKRRHYLGGWRLDPSRFLRLTSGIRDNVSLSGAERFAIIEDPTPYDRERMFGPSVDDIFAVNVETGKRTLVKNRIEITMGTSKQGRYLLYALNNQYWIADLKTGEQRNLTSKVPTTFFDLEDDHTVKQKPPFGMAGWTKGDKSVLLYDKYDIWEIGADGGRATRLTAGYKDQTIHRYVRLNPEEKFIDLANPMILSLYGDLNKKSGYAKLTGGNVTRLVWLDRRITALRKAKLSDTYAYIQQDFNASPDIYTGGPELSNMQLASNTNAFQSKFAWGRSELVDYVNKNGKKLQGALYYPANYEPGKQYPMVVYIYEKLSQGLHNYYVPSERTPYDHAALTQEGYFVFSPDIVYRDRNPGISAVECIVPAVEKVVSMGVIDRKRIGLVGHSWGAYQTAFTVTQTDIFASAIAGAPLTDLVSMYLSIYWNAGMTDARIFEISQGRMEVPFYQDLEAYMKNSPLFNLEKLHTPLMIAFGTLDGAVDWHQGVELYNAARRMDKPLVMLVYEGENHGLAKKPNQIDYHRRIMQWFGHYLQGKPAEKWITEGNSHLDRQKELEKAKKEG